MKNNKIISISEFQSRFLKYFNDWGFERFERVILLSDAFPTNFTPSGGEEHLSYILSEVNPMKNFCTIQPCFRYQDIEKISTGQHVPLFRMGVSVSVNQLELEDMIRHFLLFFDSYRLDRTKLTISIFSGGFVLGRELPADEISKAIWKKNGINENQFVFLGPEENFFVLKKQGYAGLKTEAFYEFNNEKVELAVLVKLTHAVLEDHNELYYLDSFDDSVVCLGIGTERWAAVTNNKTSLLELDEFSELMDNNMYSTMELKKMILLGYSLIHLFNDGARIKGMSHGRSSLLKKIIRKFYKAIDESSFSIEYYISSILPKQITMLINHQLINTDFHKIIHLVTSQLRPVHDKVEQ